MAFLWIRTKRDTPERMSLYLASSREGLFPSCDYLLSAVATSTAQATVQPTIGLLPMPRNPIRRFLFPSAAVQETWRHDRRPSERDGTGRISEARS